MWSSQIEWIVEQALTEDAGWGDVTTTALIAPHLWGKASILAKEDGLLAGIQIAQKVFQRVDPEIQLTALISDGQRIQPGDTVATIEGYAAGILTAERVALNFLQRLSGIATQTARYVEAIRDLPVRITDTRKTTPGLRALDKYAVKIGGGYNHRLHLGGGILIKDNHIAILRSQGMSLTDIVALVKLKSPHTLKIEIEVNTLQEAAEAASAGADIIMLDNMEIGEMRQAVQAIKGRALLEASGAINLENVRAVAETGVEFLSIGAITHSAPALDMSLEFETQVSHRKPMASPPTSSANHSNRNQH